MANIRRFDTAVTGTDFREFSYRLLNTKDFLPDILRDYKSLLSEYTHTMNGCCQPFAIVDSKNKLAGVFFVNDIIPGHKATFYCWIWGAGYTATTKRFIKDYLDSCADEYGLSRIECRTPDEKKMGKMLGSLHFKLEGRFKFGWRHQGKTTTLFQYRILYGGV